MSPIKTDRIRMAVTIRNESSATLVLERSEMQSGGWTRPWLPDRHPRIGPGEQAEWRAEGDLTVVATTGSEGRVWYRVDGDPRREVYIHFNSPLVESQYANTFHLWAPPGFFMSHSGGQGHHAALEIRFRDRAKCSVHGFKPSANGFQFGNTWSPDLDAVTMGYVWNRFRAELGPLAGALGIVPVDDDWLPLTQASQGMCGGMVFAVMDYFNARQLPPDMTTHPAGDDPVWHHIRDRLLDSFNIGGSGHRWLAYSSPHYPNGDSGFAQAVGLTRGRSWVTYRDEWPRIRAEIDEGRLCPVGLIQTDQLKVGDNHTVLAYAYEQDGQRVKLWIHDPNVADDRDDVHLEFDVTDTKGEVHVTRHGYARDKRIFAIIRLDGYNPHTPPSGRPLQVRACLARASGRWHGRLPQEAGLSRPASLRHWRSQI